MPHAFVVTSSEHDGKIRRREPHVGPTYASAAMPTRVLRSLRNLLDDPCQIGLQSWSTTSLMSGNLSFTAALTPMPMGAGPARGQTQMLDSNARASGHSLMLRKKQKAIIFRCMKTMCKNYAKNF
jgi:hypothetical protein